MLRRACAYSTAAAQEARRERTESAREVKTIGTRAPRTSPAESALASKIKILCKHVAGLEIRHDQNLGATRNLGLDALDLCGLGADGVIESKRPVEDATGYLAALGHLAEGGRLDRGRNFRGHGFNGRKNRNSRRSEPHLREQIDHVLNDVNLGIEIGKYVDCSVGNKQRLGIGRHIQNEDMADPPRRAQAGLAGRHLSHELVRMQTAFHQQFALGLVDQLDRLCGRRCAMGRIDDLKAVDIETVLASHGGNLRSGPDKDRNDEARFRRLDGTAQGSLVAWMSDNGRCGRHLLRSRDESLVL